MLARWLDGEDAWGTADRTAISAEVEAEIQAAVAQARAAPWPEPATAFDHMYAKTYPGLPAGHRG